MGRETKTDRVSVEVTRLKKIGWAIRIHADGKLWSERQVKTRLEISPSIASDLRMIDKCGFDSPMAAASRERNYCSPKPQNKK